jgi:hypothetical protein
MGGIKTTPFFLISILQNTLIDNTMKWFKKQKEVRYEHAFGTKPTSIRMNYTPTPDPLLKRVYLFQDTKEGREMAKCFESHKQGHFFYTDDFLDSAFFPHNGHHEDFFFAPQRATEKAKKDKHFTEWIKFDVLNDDNLTKYCMAGYELQIAISKHSDNSGYAQMAISEKQAKTLEYNLNDMEYTQHIETDATMNRHCKGKQKTNGQVRLSIYRPCPKGHNKVLNRMI